MVLDYYKLSEQPFGVTPDPRYLYLSATHREALASVLYGVMAGRGFTSLIAKPGMGKTTLLFDLLGKVRNSARTVFLFQSQCSPRDLLRSLLADLGVEDCGDDLVRMHKKLNETLLSEASNGRRLVVVIDEAQNLDEAVLELVRMLSNFETPREKLMHLILAGQPQLAEKLASPRMTQLRQRISIVARLKPFDAEETERYINHRLKVAGYNFEKPLFTKQALAMIAMCSGGIPRNISNICFNSMSLACATKLRTIDENVIREVLNDLDLRSLFEETTIVPKPEALRSEALNAEVLKPEVSKPEVSKPEVPITAPVPVLSEPPPKAATSSFLGGWPVRVAVSLAVIAAVSWPFVRSNRYVANVLASAAGHTPAESSGSGQTPVTEVTSSLASAMENHSPDSRFVVVLPNETLYEISFREIGKYDDEILRQFRELNPWLVDQDHIEPGQKIWVPSFNQTSQANHHAAEQVPDAPVAGAEKP